MNSRKLWMLVPLTATLSVAACRATSPPEPTSDATVIAALVDSDRDGIGDLRDHCPGTVARPTLQVDPMGCPRDTDNDGQPDFRDKCPGTAAGAGSDDAGCELDADADGIFDRNDRCPATPRGERTDATGCAPGSRAK